jgi:hypothetical protein
MACDLCNGTKIYREVKPEILAELDRLRKDLSDFTAEDLARIEKARKHAVNCLPPRPCPECQSPKGTE